MRERDTEADVHVSLQVDLSDAQHYGHAIDRYHRPWYDKERARLLAKAFRAAPRALDPLRHHEPRAVDRRLTALRWYAFWVLLPYAITRAVLLAVALNATQLMPFNPYYPGYPSVHPTPFEWVNVLSRWDGAWYVGIAQDGYAYHQGEQSNVVFSPLLPALMRLVATPVGINTVSLYVAGVLIANIALLVALGLLVAVLREPLGQKTAARMALYILIFPTTFFLSALYPHSLFIAMVLGSLYLSRNRRWWMAGVLAAAATLTRPYGVVIVVALAYEFLAQVRRGQQRPDLTLGSLALAPLALAGWTIYLWTVTGGPAGLAEASFVWNRYPVPPWTAAQRLLALIRFDSSVAGPDPADGPLALLFLPLVIAAWWRRIPALAAFGTVLLAVLISTSQLLSVSRYVVEVIPAFVVLAHWGTRKVVHWPYIVLSGTAAIVLVVGYSLGYAIA